MEMIRVGLESYRNNGRKDGKGLREGGIINPNPTVCDSGRWEKERPP